MARSRSLQHSVLIDTHILLWQLTDSPRLKSIGWLREIPVHVISPVSLLEMKYLDECGKISIDMSTLLPRLRQDERFEIDNIGIEEICLAAFELSWTRDPFDRLLVAHSRARSLPLGTLDRLIRKHYAAVV